MSEMSDYELLQLIHEHINLDTIKSQNNSITREAVDNLFSKLLEQIVKSSECRVQSSETSNFTLRTPNSPLRTKHEKLIIHTDGASRGNPGKAGIGAVIADKDGQTVEEISEYIGEATNNVAEYKALITAVRRALELGAKDVLFKLDSELIVKQVHGKYKVKTPHILTLYMELQGMLTKLQKWEMTHIPRAENSHADALANMGIDSTLV
jgi:ribonuclease HI